MTSLAEAPGFALPDGKSALGARASANGHVVITRPTARWPFMTSPAAKGSPVTTKDQSASWLRGAMLGVGVLAVAAASVSIAAQYRFVAAARGNHVIAAIEACIPDIGALIFACLGIALALRGKRAIRARFLNAGAVATSVFMNYAAAGHGWRDLAVWVMPPVAYALASDTAIANVRSWALVKQGLPDDDSSPLAVLGRLALYMLRLIVAPPSTVRGARQALLNATPLPAPSAPARLPGSAPAALASSPRQERKRPGKRRGPTKTRQLLDLVVERHGPLAEFLVKDVSKVATALAPEIGLHPGSARRELRAAVLAAQSAPVAGDVR